MELITRDKCVLTGAEDLEMVLKIDKFPISMYTVGEEEREESDLKADMQWWISKSTGCVQLGPLVPLDILYKQGHGSGAVGKTWEQHHSKLADFIRECGVKSVLEIGAGHGVLARQFVEAHSDAQYHIVEPNLPEWSHERVTMYKGMFDSNFKIDEKVDAVVHSHTFEHIYEPKQFLRDVAQFLEDGKWHIFSLPRLEAWLSKGFSNALNFEHTLYLTEANIEYLLKSSGFEVVKKVYFREDHSVFYATRKNPAVVSEAVAPKDYGKNRETFLNWVNATKDFVKSINEKISAQPADLPIFVFGGHIFTQFLIGFGMDTSRIKAILDNDPAKQGRRLYGTSLLVQSPKSQLAELKNAAVVLRAGAYNEEIKKGIRENVNPAVEFWE
jgi:2-polyprenyl-3-methyl-5-hydroxy-6-metoxy-1,4-benzoquinol methylase